MNHYTLINAEERAKSSDTFEIPPLPERCSCVLGTYVKLTIRGAHLTERLWVKITFRGVALYPYVSYAGVLDNVPFDTTLAKLGETITFGPEHISAIRAAQ